MWGNPSITNHVKQISFSFQKLRELRKLNVITSNATVSANNGASQKKLRIKTSWPMTQIGFNLIGTASKKVGTFCNSGLTKFWDTTLQLPWKRNAEETRKIDSQFTQKLHHKEGDFNQKLYSKGFHAYLTVTQKNANRNRKNVAGHFIYLLIIGERTSVAIWMKLEENTLVAS